MSKVQGPSPPFRDVFVRSAGIPEERFEVHLFFGCLPPVHRPAARMLLWIRPSVFERDFATLREVGLATSLEEVRRASRSLKKEAGHCCPAS